MTNLLLVRSVRKGETMEKSTEKYHGTLMNTCARVAARIRQLSRHEYGGFEMAGKAKAKTRQSFQSVFFYLARHHLRVVVLEEGEDLVAGGSELPLRHVPQVGHLYDGVDAAGPERERAHAALHHLDAPPEEARQAVAVAEGALVHGPVLEHAVRVVAHGVPVPVPPVHVRHHALQLLEAQLLVHHRVRAELGAPRGAAEQHRVRVARAEVPRAEELEEHHVGALVVGVVRRAGRRGVGIQRDAPDGDGVRVGGHQRLEVGERAELGRRERRRHVRVLLEGGGAEQRGSVHQRRHEAALGALGGRGCHGGGRRGGGGGHAAGVGACGPAAEWSGEAGKGTSVRLRKWWELRRGEEKRGGFQMGGGFGVERKNVKGRRYDGRAAPRSSGVGPGWGGGGGRRDEMTSL
jgi:hypothetical protein